MRGGEGREGKVGEDIGVQRRVGWGGRSRDVRGRSIVGKVGREASGGKGREGQGRGKDRRAFEEKRVGLSARSWLVSSQLALCTTLEIRLCLGGQEGRLEADCSLRRSHYDRSKSANHEQGVKWR